jgi:DNA-binding response OmpR family regulator
MGILKMEMANQLNDGDRNKDFLRVVLIESNSSIREPLVAVLTKDNHLIASCTNANEANRAISSQMPDLIIIGDLEDLSSLEAFREYSNRCQNVSIILLSHTPDVNQFFRDWVISKGGYDVLSSSPQNFDLFRSRLQRLMHPEQAPEQAATSPAKVEAISTPTTPPSLPDPPQPSPPQPQQNSEQAQKISLETTEIANPSPEPSPQTLTYQQTLSALNQISESSLKYFGGLVIGNYWKKSHVGLVAEHPWLERWSVNHAGVISFDSDNMPQELLTEEQFKSLKLWVKGFLKECDRIILDFVELLKQSNPSFEVMQTIA